MGIYVELHGPLTNNIELMVRMMKHFDDSLAGANFDTGNTFIAGNDPAAMAREMMPSIRHFHVKDLAPELKAQVGKDTGIAASEVYAGEGINAGNSKAIAGMMTAAEAAAGL